MLNLEKTGMPDLDAFHEELLAKNYDGLWRIGAKALTSSPANVGLPTMWKWDEAHKLLMKAKDLVDPQLFKGGERRVLLFSNPEFGGQQATHSMTSTFQLVKAGEKEASHRHSPDALRFMLKGRATTIVNGEPIEMNEGDLITTPGGSWHGHMNNSTDDAYWLDGVMAPLPILLRGMFFEPHPSKGLQPVEYTPSYSRALVGNGRLRPKNKPKVPDYPAMVYPIQEVYEELKIQKKYGELDPFDGYMVEYINPVTGGSLMRQMSASMQLLPVGFESKAHQHSSSVIYHVYQGEGYSVIDGKRFDWKKGDTFAVPVWCVHEHVNTSENKESLLFSFSDEPIMRAAGLYREQEFTENNDNKKGIGIKQNRELYST